MRRGPITRHAADTIPTHRATRIEPAASNDYGLICDHRVRIESRLRAAFCFGKSGYFASRRDQTEPPQLVGDDSRARLSLNDLLSIKRAALRFL